MHVLVFVCLSLNGMLSDFILLHFFYSNENCFLTFSSFPHSLSFIHLFSHYDPKSNLFGRINQFSVCSLSSLHRGIVGFCWHKNDHTKETASTQLQNKKKKRVHTHISYTRLQCHNGPFPFCPSPVHFLAIIKSIFQFRQTKWPKIKTSKQTQTMYVSKKKQNYKSKKKKYSKRNGYNWIGRCSTSIDCELRRHEGDILNSRKK